MPDFLATAVEIARAAGGLLVPIFERGVRVEYKGEVDLVTEADRASERLIVERLRAHFPDHGIVAEEGGGQAGESPYCWYVDPVDGTTNFAHGFPFFCVSIGLERDGEVLLKREAPFLGVLFPPRHEAQQLVSHRIRNRALGQQMLGSEDLGRFGKDRRSAQGADSIDRVADGRVGSDASASVAAAALAPEHELARRLGGALHGVQAG